MRAFAGLAIAAALFASPAFAAEGPFTEAQLKKGQSEYNPHCRTCHAKAGSGALGPALVGDTFKSHFGGQTAADVRAWIFEFMPQTAPKSLKDEQLDPLLAYILSLNGYTPGATELSAETAKSVTIEEK